MLACALGRASLCRANPCLIRISSFPPRRRRRRHLRFQNWLATTGGSRKPCASMRGKVARLRGEVLSAAESEAAEIVATARAEVRRIIVNARGNDLLGLAAQIQVITDTAPELGTADTPSLEPLLPASDGIDLRDRLLGARRDVRRVLDEARPDIDGLRENALNCTSRTKGEPLRRTPRRKSKDRRGAVQCRRPDGRVNAERRHVGAQLSPDHDRIRSASAPPPTDEDLGHGVRSREPRRRRRHGLVGPA